MRSIIRTAVLTAAVAAFTVTTPAIGSAADAGEVSYAFGVAGTDVTYAITVSNPGASDAQAVSISDTIPAGTTFRSVTPPSGWTCNAPAAGTPGPVAVTCSRATLAWGASGQFSVTVRLAASAGDGSQLCNTASISSSTSDPATANNSSQTCGTVRTSADLALSQTVSTIGKAGKGTAIFTLVTTNNGPSDAVGVSLTATSSLFSVPAPAISAPSGASCTAANQTVTCSWAAMPVGSTATVMISVPWRSAVGQVCTVGTVSAGTSDPNAVNNTASACIGKKGR